MRGSLAQVSFADILLKISTDKRTGVLSLSPARGGATVRVFFRHAQAIKVETSNRDKSHLLGERLVRAELVSRGDLLAALKTHKRTLRRLGDVLVDLAGVSASQVQLIVDLQAREALYNVFEWKDGRFEFQPGGIEFAPVITPIDAEQLMLEGFKVMDEWPVVRARINNYAVVYRLVRTSGSGVGPDSLNEHAKRVLSLVDAERSVRSLIERSALGEFETCKALSTLVSHGYIVATKRRSARPDPSGRETRGWFQSAAIVFYNLVLTSAFGYSLYLFAPLIPSGGVVEVEPLERAVEEQALFAFGQRIKPALSIYRARYGRYPDDLGRLIDAGVLSERYRGLTQSSRVEYVSIGTDYELLTLKATR